MLEVQMPAIFLSYVAFASPLQKNSMTLALKLGLFFPLPPAFIQLIYQSMCHYRILHTSEVLLFLLPYLPKSCISLRAFGLPAIRLSFAGRVSLLVLIVCPKNTRAYCLQNLFRIDLEFIPV